MERSVRERSVIVKEIIPTHQSHPSAVGAPAAAGPTPPPEGGSKPPRRFWGGGPAHPDRASCSEYLRRNRQESLSTPKLDGFRICAVGAEVGGATTTREIKPFVQQDRAQPLSLGSRQQVQMQMGRTGIRDEG